MIRKLIGSMEGEAGGNSRPGLTAEVAAPNGPALPRPRAAGPPVAGGDPGRPFSGCARLTGEASPEAGPGGRRARAVGQAQQAINGTIGT